MKPKQALGNTIMSWWSYYRTSVAVKTLPHFQAPTLQISGGARYIYEVHDIKLTATFNRCPTHLSAL